MTEKIHTKQDADERVRFYAVKNLTTKKINMENFNSDKADVTGSCFPTWFTEEIQTGAKSFYQTDKAEAARWLFGISINNGTLNDFGMKEILKWLESNCQ